MTTWYEQYDKNTHVRSLPSADIILQRMPYRQRAIVSIGLNLGSYMEIEDIRGITHFLEHLICNGSEKYNKDFIDNVLPAMGININAYTDKDKMVVYSECFPDQVEYVYDILRSIIFEANFTKEDVEKERHIILSEIEDRKSAIWNRRWESYYFKAYGKGYGSPIIGYERTVKSMDYELLTNWMLNIFDRISIVIVGDVSEDILDRLDITNAIYVENKFIPPTFRTGEAFEAEDETTSCVMFGFLDTPGYTLKEYNTLSILESCLFHGFGSVFYNELREKEGLCYSPGGYFIEDRLQKMFIALATCPTEDQEKLSNRLREIMTNIPKYLTEKLFDNHKKILLNAIRSNIDSIYSVYSHLMDIPIIDNLVSRNQSVNSKQALTYEDVIEQAQDLSKWPSLILIRGNTNDQ